MFEELKKLFEDFKAANDERMADSTFPPVPPVLLGSLVEDQRQLANVFSQDFDATINSGLPHGSFRSDAHTG